MEPADCKPRGTTIIVMIYNHPCSERCRRDHFCRSRFIDLASGGGYICG